MLSFLVLSAVVRADTLTLEFAQEGEPEIPRAVILIHNAFENRQDMSAVLKRWGSRS